MKITLKTTIREIAGRPEFLSLMNEASHGLFNNPGIMQADSMPLERIAGFLPQNGLAMMQGIIDRANELLEKTELPDERDAVQEEIDASAGLEATEAPVPPCTYRSIRPGKVWRDTEGHRIQAHGGTMYCENGRYYWIGENKDHTEGTGNIWTWGLKIYSSDDLYNWQDEGYLIPPELKDKSSLFYPKRRLDRPHLLYNRKSGQYVLWIKFIDEAHFSVLVSDSLKSGYRLVERELRPFGANCGDFDLAVDPETDRAYLYFEANHKDVWGVRLNESYTGVEGEKEVIYENVPLPYTREGLAHVMHEGRHYLFSSGMTGYLPNPSEVCVSDDWITGYTVIGNPHINDASCASFNSQISNIFKVNGKDQYVVMADRWVPDCVITKDIYERIVRIIEARKNPEITVSDEDRRFFASLPMIASARTAVADYVWLPLSFGENGPEIKWQDEWQLEDKGASMENIIDFPHFEKKNDYIICIDSDGTVMDAMNVKHKKCFGPCFVEVFGLGSKAEEVLAVWNQVNLHGETRARNRFITVLIMLKKYNEDLHYDLSALEQWEATTDMLTNGSLVKEIEKTQDEVLKRVYLWSLRCNEEISKLTFEDKKPFEGAKDFFKAVQGQVDLAVVSSSNIKALMEEWTHFGLYEYMSLLTSQEDGTKPECIDKIMQYGYAPDHVIMMGDAIVDLETAEQCGVFFYPVVPEQEVTSWRELKDRYCRLFTEGHFSECQEELVEKFREA